jgi:hypothetical protein
LVVRIGGLTYFRERDFRALIAQHVKAAVPEMGAVEGTGAVNFLELDDIPIAFEGEPLDPASVIELPAAGGKRDPRKTTESTATSFCCGEVGGGL